MKVPGKTNIVFPILILLLATALVIKKLLLPFSSTFLIIVFDAVAVSFFLRAFLVMSKDKSTPNMLGIQLNVMPIIFCVGTLALLIRLENWRGGHAWTKVAFLLLLLIFVPFLLSLKLLFKSKKEAELILPNPNAQANDSKKKETILNMGFTFFLPWAFLFTLICISVFSNPRQFHNLFNGTTYEQYVRQKYSQAMGTELLEKYKPNNASSAITATNYFNLAKEQEAKEDYDDALQSFNKAIDLNPDYAEAIYRRGLLRLTKLDLTTDRAEEAINDFSRAIEIKPEYATAYYHRAVALNFLEHGNSKEAKQDLIKAASLDSSLRNDSYLMGILKSESEKVGK